MESNCPRSLKFGLCYVIVYSMTENEIGTIIVGKAIEVHRILGPSMLESAYESALATVDDLYEAVRAQTWIFVKFWR
jgi:hypothetical protein